MKQAGYKDWYLVTLKFGSSKLEDMEKSIEEMNILLYDNIGAVGDIINCRGNNYQFSIYSRVEKTELLKELDKFFGKEYDIWVKIKKD